MENRSGNGHKAEDVADEIGSLADNAKSVIAALQKKVNDSIGTAFDATKKTRKEVEAFVEDNPWHFVAIALAVGVATGLLIQKSRSK